jgi:hypothetical protein
MANPDGNSVTLPDALAIQDGGAPQLSVNVTGPSLVRVGTQALFDVIVSNTGTVDATFVTVEANFSATGIEVGMLAAMANAPFVVELPGTIIPAGGFVRYPIPFTPLLDSQCYHSQAQVTQHPPPPYCDTLRTNVENLTKQFYALLEKYGDMIQRVRECQANDPNDIGCLILVSQAAFLKEKADQVGRQLEVEEVLLAVCERIHGGSSSVQSVSTQVSATQADDSWTWTSNVCAVGSIDPNSKIGDAGYGAAGYIRGSIPLSYVVDFENLPSATAPAATVTVRDSLDPTLDVTTVVVNSVRFGDTTISVPEGVNPFTDYIDLRPAKNLLLGIRIQTDGASRSLVAQFVSIDPTTGKPTTDPVAGFLDPGEEGSVSFTVVPTRGLASGTQIANRADITFDQNLPISTGVWRNTIDSVVPISHVSPLAATQSVPNFLVTWSGTDADSGLKDFTIYVSDDAGPFAPFQTETTATAAIFAGQVGHTYAFYSIARDLVGNIEGGKSTSEATTQVVPSDTTPTITVVVPSQPPSAAGWNNSNVTIGLVSADNSDGSGVKEITYSVAGAQSVPSTTVAGNVASVPITVEGVNTLTFYASDNAGNIEAAHTLTVRLDKTAPTITASRTPASTNGWNYSPVTVSFQCSDAVSGLAPGSPPAPTVLSTDGSGQSVTGTCRDVAGNSASVTVGPINITILQANTTTSVTSSVNPSAFAQSVSFTATVSASGSETGRWQIADPGLPAGVFINSIWARNRNDTFVWGSRTNPDTAIPESYLYHWDGHGWSQALYLANAWSIGVFGTGTSEVWLSAYQAPNGPGVIYRSTTAGVTWTQQTLPSQIGNNRIGGLTGTPNNIHASAGDNTILRFDGSSWSALDAGRPSNASSPGPVTMLSANEGYYTTCWGWGSWDGASWTYHPNGFDFCDVSQIWGMRDASNNLVLYTGGNNNFSNGVRVWKLQGSTFGSKGGYVFGDPTDGPYDFGGVLCGGGSYGYATGVWGSAPNDIWVTGKLGVSTTDCTGTGHVYHYDGSAWADLTATLKALVGGTLPTTTAVTGTAADDLWVALADGRILRYTTAASQATPTGTVQFTDNGSPMGSPVALNAGVARITTTSLASQTHVIGARFSGDAKFGTSGGSMTQTVSDAVAHLVYPINGATSVDLTQPFSWTSVPNVQAYYLYVGTSAGAKDLVNTGELQQTSYRVPLTLPSGTTLYARLWTKVAGTWRSVDATFTAAPTIARFTYPATGTTTVDSTMPLTWTTVATAQAYYLYVGSTLEAKDLVNTGEIQQTSYLVRTTLPTNQTLYARLWTKVGGTWRYVDATFRAAPLIARFTNPAVGTTIVDPSQPLAWTTVATAQAYYLYVGSILGAKDLVNTGEIQQTSYLLRSTVPVDQTLYARLWTKVDGVWLFTDRTFSVMPLIAHFTYPATAGTTIDRTQPLAWTTVATAQAYYLYVGTTVGAKDLVNTGEIHQTSYWVPLTLPINMTLYVRLWTKVADRWRSVDTTFKAESVIAQFISPTNGGAFCQGQWVVWSAVPGAQAYSLNLGTTPGATDLLNTGETLATSYIPLLPSANTPLYARLWTKVNGVWYYVDATFTRDTLVFCTQGL